MQENHGDFFEIIWLSNEFDANKPKIRFEIHSENVDQLKESLVNRENASVILILSDNLSFNDLSLTDFPQICAIYNDKFVCLYCLPEMIPLVNDFIKNNQETEEDKTNPTKSCLSSILSLFRKYWFLLGLMISIFLAYLYPDLGKTGGYLRAEWSIKLGCVILIFFLNGLSVRTEDLAKEFLNIRLHLFVQISSLLIIPFTIYGLTLLLLKFNLNKMLIFGLILMGSTSTTISSNVIMTKNAMGNSCAALLNAILGNILGIFISPALILYFLKNPTYNLFFNRKNSKQEIDYKRIVQNLSLTVLLPLFVGQIIHFFWTKQVTYLREKFYFNHINSIALLIVLWSVFCTAFATGSFNIIENKDLFILIFIDTGIYVFFSLFVFILARLPIQYWQFSKIDTIPIVFCSSMKSLAMGLQIINAFFQNQNQQLIGLISLPLVIYHVQQLILSAIQVILFKKWIKNDKNIQNLQSNNKQHLQIDETQPIDINH